MRLAELDLTGPSPHKDQGKEKSQVESGGMTTTLALTRLICVAQTNHACFCSESCIGHVGAAAAEC